eukprot:2267562-Pyramimonas_sp.AAC.1
MADSQNWSREGRCHLGAAESNPLPYEPVPRCPYLRHQNISCRKRRGCSHRTCLLYTSDAADDTPCVDL